jgi:hypothetical protein
MAPVLARYETVDQKGSSTIILVDPEGYSYSKSSTNGSRKTWRCSKKKKHCKASMTTMDDWIIRRRNQHNHDPNPLFIQPDVILPENI